MTIEATEHLLTEQEARRLTERIRTALDRVSTAWADLAERIGEAYDRRADLALGYSSWAEYADAELKPPSALAAEVRRELVGLLSARGMSTRAIAPAVGVRSDSTIRADIAQVRDHRAPATGSTVVINGTIVAQSERIDPATGEVLDVEPYPQLRRAPWPERRDEPVADPTSVTVGGGEAPAVAEPRKVTGLDGKQYSRPEPATPRRKALPEQFMTATLALADRVAAIVRLAEDDRFAANAEKVATANRSDLIRAIDALSGVVAKLPERNPS